MRRALPLALALASGAVAAPMASAAITGPASPTKADPVVVTWTTVDLSVVSYAVEIDGNLVNTLPAPASSLSVPGIAEGSHSVRVTELDATGGLLVAYDDTFTVDRTPPVLGAPVVTGTAGLAGWYTSAVTVTWPCSGAVNCPAPVVLSAQAGGPAPANPNVYPAVSVADAAGNVASQPGGGPFNIDKFAPVITIGANPSGNIQLGTAAPAHTFSCDTGDTSGLATCASTLGTSGTPFDFGVPGQRNGATLGPRTVTVTASDNAGNVQTPVTIAYNIVDTIKPTKPAAATPSDVSNVTRPTFTWAKSTDGGTGVAKYAIYLDGRTTPAFDVKALTDSGNEPDEYSVALPASAAGVPAAGLSTGTHTWKVRAIDGQGNFADSDALTFRVDTTAPAQPGLTGPTGFTTSRTPTFAATGVPGAQFSWIVERVVDGTGTTVQSGGPTPSGTITPGALADGSYRIKVRQISSIGNPGAYATLSFTVDATPPAAPTAVVGGGTTGDPQPAFSWAAGEAGGTFRWQVLGPAGDVRMGPGTVNTTSVRMPSPLLPGAYTFRLQQIDAAGNVSAATDVAFTVAGPPAVQVVNNPPTTGLPGTNSVRRTQTLPTTNASKLFPRRGLSVRAAPRLRWPRVRGATIYNVQVFRVNAAGARTPFTKIVSAFPKRNSYTVPASKLKRGQRYLWRVWPYLGAKRRYAAKVVGQSWFQVSPKAKLVVKRPTRTTKK